MEVRPQPVLVTSSEMKKIKNAIEDVKSNGGLIRSIFENYNEPNSSVEWEVDAAVECFQMFSSRWTIEILAALYIAGDRRFNEMRGLLKGISSRTLSDNSELAKKAV